MSAYRAGAESLKNGNYYVTLNPFCKKLQPEEHEEWSDGWLDAFRAEKTKRSDTRYVIAHINEDFEVVELEIEDFEEARKYARNLWSRNVMGLSFTDSDGYSHCW